MVQGAEFMNIHSLESQQLMSLPCRGFTLQRHAPSTRQAHDGLGASVLSQLLSCLGLLTLGSGCVSCWCRVLECMGKTKLVEPIKINKSGCRWWSEQLGSDMVVGLDMVVTGRRGLGRGCSGNQYQK